VRKISAETSELTWQRLTTTHEVEALPAFDDTGTALDFKTGTLKGA